MENYKFSVGDKVRYLNWIHEFVIIDLITHGGNYEVGHRYRIEGKFDNGGYVSGPCYEKDLTIIEPFSPSYDYIPTQEAEEDDI